MSRENFLSTVVIKTTALGVPRAIVLDGMEIPNVASARIEYAPNGLALAIFTVNVGELRTEVVE